MKQILLIAAGGGLGAAARWWLAGCFTGARGTFPLGIFIVNVSGCFLFGLLHGMCQARGAEWSLALLTGLLGGYTTFSTFGWDTFDLIRQDRVGLAAANAVLSVVAGVVAVWAGVALSGRSAGE